MQSFDLKIERFSRADFERDPPKVRLPNGETRGTQFELLVFVINGAYASPFVIEHKLSNFVIDPNPARVRPECPAKIVKMP